MAGEQPERDDEEEQQQQQDKSREGREQQQAMNQMTDMPVRGAGGAVLVPVGLEARCVVGLARERKRKLKRELSLTSSFPARRPFPILQLANPNQHTGDGGSARREQGAAGALSTTPCGDAIGAVGVGVSGRELTATTTPLPLQNPTLDKNNPRPWRPSPPPSRPTARRS